MSREEADPFLVFEQRTRDALASALKELGISTIPPLEDPPEGMGDIGIPMFTLAREAKQAPASIASSVSAIMARGGAEGLGFEAAGPYVNVRIDDTAMARATLKVLRRGDVGRGVLQGKGEKLALEHTSANPNGPLHVGRARNPIIGDTLARLLRFAGSDLEVLYWVNDMGKQMAFLTWGLYSIKEEALPPEDDPKIDHRLVRYYQMAVAMSGEIPLVEKEVNRLLWAYESAVKRHETDTVIFEGGKIDDPRIEYHPIRVSDIQGTCMKVLEGMRGSLERMNVSYDRFILESGSVEDSSVERVIERLNSSDHSGTSEDGARYLELAPFGIKGRNTRFTYTRSDGTSLYTTRDLAFHEWKLDTYSGAINVLGEDHKLQARQLAIALGILGHDHPPTTIFHSFVSLPEGKMSTRKARVVYLDDLLDEAVARARVVVDSNRPELSATEAERISEFVGIGAVRYNIINVQTDKKIVFKWEDALNFDGASAPFVQYSHARICGILRKAALEGIDVEARTLSDAVVSADLSCLTPMDHKLLRTVARFPSLVAEVAENMKLHLIPEYAQSLAATFHSFYALCPVVSAPDEELRRLRLFMVSATRDVLANLLDILGIEAPGSM